MILAVADGPIFFEFATALVAKAGPQMVFSVTLQTAIRQFATRKGHEPTIDSFDNLEVEHNKSIVECDRTEGSQTLMIAAVDQLHANFGDNHDVASVGF